MTYLKEALYERLKVLAGGRIYNVKAPDNVIFPCIIQQSISMETDRLVDPDEGQNFTREFVNIDIFAKTDIELETLTSQVLGLIENFQGVILGLTIFRIFLDNSTDLYDSAVELFRKNLLFDIQYLRD